MHWDPLPQSTDVRSKMERCRQLLVQVQRNPRISRLLHPTPTLLLLPRLEDSLRMSIRTQSCQQPHPPSPTQCSEPVSPLLHLFTSLLLPTPTVDTTPIHRLETADMFFNPVTSQRPIFTTTTTLSPATPTKVATMAIWDRDHLDTFSSRRPYPTCLPTPTTSTTLMPVPVTSMPTSNYHNNSSNHTNNNNHTSSSNSQCTHNRQWDHNLRARIQ